MSSRTSRLASPPPPEDFLAFLEERRGVDSRGARSLLGNWLLSYEPTPWARSQLGAKPGSHEAAPHRESPRSVAA